ncbi:hypothetical protein F4801DRAFT_501383 [Xylaria longipes]|nr:hypothetical protein F4801DRAFT_501383 [Xylaria longipes]
MDTWIGNVYPWLLGLAWDACWLGRQCSLKVLCVRVLAYASVYCMWMWMDGWVGVYEKGQSWKLSILL